MIRHKRKMMKMIEKEYVWITEEHKKELADYIAQQFLEVHTLAENIPWSARMVLFSLLQGGEIDRDFFMIGGNYDDLRLDERDIEKVIKILKQANWIKSPHRGYKKKQMYIFNLEMLERLRLYHKIISENSLEENEDFVKFLDVILVRNYGDFERESRDRICAEFLEQKGEIVLSEPGYGCDVPPLKFPIKRKVRLKDGSYYTLAFHEKHINDKGELDATMLRLPGEVKKAYDHLDCSVRQEINSINLVHADELMKISKGKL